MPWLSFSWEAPTLKVMHRILILDSDHPLRDQLTDVLGRTVNTEVAVASDVEDLLSKVKHEAFAALFVDGDLLAGDSSRLIGAVRACTVRPMLVIASNQKTEDLDPDLVTLVVRKPYDLLMLTGVLLSALIEVPADGVEPGAPAADRRRATGGSI
jgi:DNA-binding NtrC family response regulator